MSDYADAVRVIAQQLEPPERGHYWSVLDAAAQSADPFQHIAALVWHSVHVPTRGLSSALLTTAQLRAVLVAQERAIAEWAAEVATLPEVTPPEAPE